jgi:hypothetical protein
MEFGRLLCLPKEAAQKVQNIEEKKLTLDTLGGIKFILTSSPPLPFPTSCNSCQGFYSYQNKKYV